jgi:hypothetical protein
LSITLVTITISIASAASAPAHADAFTSSSEFALATTGLTVENYGTYSAGTLVPSGSTLGSLNYRFNTASNLGGVITNLYNSFSGNSLAAKQVVGSLSSADFFFPSESFTVTFPTPVTAVGIFSNTFLPVTAFLVTSSGAASTTWNTYDTSTFGFLGFMLRHLLLQQPSFKLLYLIIFQKLNTAWLFPVPSSVLACPA